MLVPNKQGLAKHMRGGRRHAMLILPHVLRHVVFMLEVQDAGPIQTHWRLSAIQGAHVCRPSKQTAAEAAVAAISTAG